MRWLGWKVFIPELAIIPPGYGVAWLDMTRCGAICMPLPISKIAGAFRAWYYVWRRPCADDPFVKVWMDGYHAGHHKGKMEVYREWADDIRGMLV